MTQTFDAQTRWNSPTQEDLVAIDRLMNPNVPLEESVGRLPASGVGGMKSHHHRPFTYNPLQERIDALHELASERLLEGRGGDESARSAALVDYLRFAKAASILGQFQHGIAKGGLDQQQQRDHELER